MNVIYTNTASILKKMSLLGFSCLRRMKFVTSNFYHILNIKNTADYSFHQSLIPAWAMFESQRFISSSTLSAPATLSSLSLVTSFTNHTNYSYVSSYLPISLQLSFIFLTSWICHSLFWLTFSRSLLALKFAQSSNRRKSTSTQDDKTAASSPPIPSLDNKAFPSSGNYENELMNPMELSNNIKHGAAATNIRDGDNKNLTKDLMYFTRDDDLSNSFVGASIAPFPKEVCDVLLEPLATCDIEIKPGKTISLILSFSTNKKVRRPLISSWDKISPHPQ